MELKEAILSRRSVFKFKQEPIPEAIVRELLEFGVWAPNHHITQPWRFTLIGDQTKRTLAKRYAEIQIGKAAEHIDAEMREKIGQAGHDKFMSKPTILAVSCIQDGDDQRQREDYAAVCCAMQNVQLAAWEQGIGIQWSTGPITLEEGTYEQLGIDSQQEYIIGFFYMGYPAEVRDGKREPAARFVRTTV